MLVGIILELLGCSHLNEAAADIRVTFVPEYVFKLE